MKAGRQPPEDQLRGRLRRGREGGEDYEGKERRGHDAPAANPAGPAPMMSTSYGAIASSLPPHRSRGVPACKEPRP